jgi:hypothetical protein
LGLNEELTWGPTVDELAGPVYARLAFQPLCEITAAAQAGSQSAPSVCLVGLFVSPARCSQAVAARAASPPYAARAAQPSSFNRTAQDAVEPPLNCGTCAPGASASH